jgi:hypothetical protein
MQITTRGIGYSLLSLLSVYMIYVFLNLGQYKFIMTKLTRIEPCSMPNYLKKLSNSFVLNHFNNVNSIPGTTGPGIPNIIRSILSTKYGPVNPNATSFYGAGSGIFFFRQSSSCLSLSCL